jgi:hypothetical protein
MLPIQLLIFCCLIFVIGGIMSEPKASVPGGELTEMLSAARKKIEQAEELLRRSCPFLYCDSGCGCEGYKLYKEIKLFLAPPAQKAEIKE